MPSSPVELLRRRCTGFPRGYSNPFQLRLIDFSAKHHMQKEPGRLLRILLDDADLLIGHPDVIKRTEEFGLEDLEPFLAELRPDGSANVSA